MLDIKMDHENSIAIFQPSGPLSESDFVNAAKVIDPFIAENGNLLGLIISTREFPGWESFGALIKHIKFVKNYHDQLLKVAIVTDSAIGNLGEKIGSHFVSAEIKHYPYDQFVSAKNWIQGEETI